jgi:hypothetical protein
MTVAVPHSNWTEARGPVRPFLYLYDGGPGFEFGIPYDKIDRFNELTLSRTRVQP